MFRRPFFISTFLLNFKTVCFADFAYHACRDSMVGGFVNQNKRALCMVVLANPEDEANLAKVREQVTALCNKYPVYGA